MHDLIVCGCCPRGAAHQAIPLRQRLDSLGTPHDIIEVEWRGGPRAEAPAKPVHILAAMDRHPGKTILFVDVGCQIVGSRGDLARAADIAGDIALFAPTQFLPDGKPVLVPHTETVVLRPTAKAHVLVSAWIEAWETGAPAGLEQDALTVALGRVPELSITLLGAEFCTTRQDNHPLPVILHERVGADAKAAGSLEKLARRISRLAAQG